MLILLFTIIAGGFAISPAAYYEGLEACKSRAQTLRDEEGFVKRCWEHVFHGGIAIALHATDVKKIDFICKYRALSDLFSSEHSIPGTVSADPLLSANIPADCRYVVVGNIPPSESFTSVDGVFVSQALSRLVSVHESGFSVDVELNSDFFTVDAVLRLNPMRMKPLVLPSGQLDPRGMRLIKADLEKFQGGLLEHFADISLIRDFGHWIRKIRIDRTEIPTPTEYAEWISRFALSNLPGTMLPEPPVSESVLETPAVAEFLSVLSMCENEMERAGSDDIINEGDEFLLLASGEVLTVGESILGGANGDVFLTSNPDILIKTTFDISSFCNEFAALTVLKGLGGRVPELYEVADPVGRMIVMSRLGKSDWPQRDDSERPSNEHLAKVIEVMRDLHEAGFVHQDLHERNIRIDADDVFFIDFGSVTPVYTSGGGGPSGHKTGRSDAIG